MNAELAWCLMERRSGAGRNGDGRSGLSSVWRSVGEELRGMLMTGSCRLVSIGVLLWTEVEKICVFWRVDL